MPEPRKPIVSLDLSRDLPKVRKQFKAVLAALESNGCDYTAPCVVGAMVPPSKRERLEDCWKAGSTLIGDLIAKGFVSVPAGQKRDFVSLQKAFDSCNKQLFVRTLARVEAKYQAA